jgi:hypothetical protein
VAGISADVTTVAANVAGVTSFAEKYRVGTTDPATSLDEGDLFYNTSSNLLKVYNGTAWETGVTPGSGFMSGSNNLSDVADAATSRENLGVGSTDNVSFAQVDILAQGDLRLQDTTGGQYVALQAPGTVATSYTLTLPAADGTSGQFLSTDGAGALSFAGVAAVDFQEFTASGTWTKPAGARLVLVRVWGAGGGGQGGHVANASTNKVGGDGGGGGAFYEKYFDAAQLGSTVTVTTGAGGAGGVGSQAIGASGGTSSFGPFITCAGGGGGNTSGVVGGGAQGATAQNTSVTVPSLSGAPVANAGYYGGGSSGIGNVAAGAGYGSAFGGAGGGAAGGESSPNTLSAPAAGGISLATSSTAQGGGGTAGTTNASAPTNGGDGTSIGMGGGGGGSATTAAKAGNGGAGGIAGGGGGGGTNRTGLLSGDGGAGGDGLVEVYTW